MFKRHDANRRTRAVARYDSVSFAATVLAVAITTVTSVAFAQRGAAMLATSSATISSPRV
jgi:hypothetical protein